jgi:Flp pilus assembly protein TadG
VNGKIITADVSRKETDRMLKHKLHSDAGSAIVELALTLPMLTLLVIGAAEIGRMAYAAIEVTEAARAAVAYGSQNGNAAGDVGGMQNAANAAAPDVSSLLTFTNGSPNFACVCDTISSSGTVTTSPSTPGSCASMLTTCITANSTEIQKIVPYVQVFTQATVPTMFHYPGIPSSFTLTGSAQMRVIQ